MGDRILSQIPPGKFGGLGDTANCDWEGGYVLCEGGVSA
jgi:hypothetical protein